LFEPFSGLVLKEEVSLCGFRAFLTQVDNILVIFGKGMAVNEIFSENFDRFKDVATSIGHEYVKNQVCASN
jgi:hypothetical protein